MQLKHSRTEKQNGTPFSWIFLSKPLPRYKKKGHYKFGILSVLGEEKLFGRTRERRLRFGWDGGRERGNVRR